MPPLISGLDHVEWDSRRVEKIVDEVRAQGPVWLRVANFFGRTAEMLSQLDRPQLVLWKLEFWGLDTPYDLVPASPGVDPSRYTDELFAMGHHVVPYAFSEWGRDRLASMIPALRKRPVAILPIAQKTPVASVDRDGLRKSLGIPLDVSLVGCGGLLHPAKGIDEIVGTFLRAFPEPDAHLLCALVVEDEDDTDVAIRLRWEKQFGRTGMERVHVHTGPYGDWAWMCGFYQAVDLVLVNSLSDSWGRMVAEPLGFGVPTLVRRADCGTNHIAPGVVLVDRFSELSPMQLGSLIGEAKARSPRLSAYVEQHYGIPDLRQRWLNLLRAETPRERRETFDEAATDPESLVTLDELVAY